MHVLLKAIHELSNVWTKGYVQSTQTPLVSKLNNKINLSNTFGNEIQLTPEHFLLSLVKHSHFKINISDILNHFQVPSVLEPYRLTPLHWPRRCTPWDGRYCLRQGGRGLQQGKWSDAIRKSIPHLLSI